MRLFALREELAYAVHVFLALLSAPGAALPPCAGPFRGETTTPHARLISSPAGGASPSSVLLWSRSVSPSERRRHALPS
jgi:hypothetical protein